MKYSIETTSDFNEWFEDQKDKVKGLVRARFSRIQLDVHFGTVKSLGDGVYELKWFARLLWIFRKNESTCSIRRK